MCVLVSFQLCYIFVNRAEEKIVWSFKWKFKFRKRWYIISYRIVVSSGFLEPLHIWKIFFSVYFFLVCNISMYQVSKSKRRFFPSNLWNINMREELLDYEQFFCLFTSLKIPFSNSKQKYKYYMFIVWIKGAVCDVAEMRRSFVFLSSFSSV